MKFIQTYFSSQRFFIVVLLVTFLNSCFMYHSQKPALVKGVDIDQSLMVASDEIKKTDMSESLSIWVLRDQIIQPRHAKVIAELYLTHIDGMTSPFNIWHSSWAISNLYRLGSEEVKKELEVAYKKAITQTSRIDDSDDFKEAAEDHINGKQVVTGFIHFGGLYYAYTHLVVPGNKNYLQSYDEYLENEKNKGK